MSDASLPTLVIDSSVMRSAGGINATHATSVACRDTLAAIQTGGWRVAISTAILREWLNHSSVYAKHWQLLMQARGRFESVDGSVPHALIAEIDSKLELNVRPVVAKDHLLLDAALKTERRIISLDIRTRDHLRRICNELAELATVYWIVPSGDCLTWLSLGAPDAHEFRVCPLLEAAP